jgi:hypothetical protein
MKNNHFIMLINHLKIKSIHLIFKSFFLPCNLFFELIILINLKLKFINKIYLKIHNQINNIPQE